MSSKMEETTDALRPPLITLMTKKSPITSTMTKIEPKAMPLRESGTMTSHMMRAELAPASRAASISALSMRAIELKIGTIMNSVKRWT